MSAVTKVLDGNPVSHKVGLYSSMYTDTLMKYSNTKFDMVLVKGRARPQFAVWAFLSGLIKPKALVYMFDTASGGRKHYKTEDFFNVKLETQDGKGHQPSKNSKNLPQKTFEEWLQEYNF